MFMLRDPDAQVMHPSQRETIVWSIRFCMFVRVFFNSTVLYLKDISHILCLKLHLYNHRDFAPVKLHAPGNHLMKQSINQSLLF